MNSANVENAIRAAATPAWIPTRSGARFRPLAPRVEDVTIEDIACGLAATARWCGQTRVLYTVAQHSMEVADRLDGDERLWGLLHDAAEAYLADLPRPIKGECYFRRYTPAGDMYLPFAVVEIEILKVVAERFGLAWPIPPRVLEVDDRVLATEARDLFDAGQQARLPGVEATPYPEHTEPIPPRLVRQAFISTFEAFTAERFPRLAED